MWDTARGSFGRRVCRQASSSIVCYLFLISSFCSVADDKQVDFFYDYFDVVKGPKKTIVFSPAPIAGKCIFSLGAKGGDHRVVMSVFVEGKYVVASSAIWTLYLPKNRPLPLKWVESGNEFRYMGDEFVVVGNKNVIAKKIGIFGGSVNESTEIWVSDKYGVLAYRPMESSGKFILRKLRDNSFLDCR